MFTCSSMFNVLGSNDYDKHSKVNCTVGGDDVGEEFRISMKYASRTILCDEKSRGFNFGVIDHENYCPFEDFPSNISSA